MIGSIDSYKDPIAGEVSLERVRQIVSDMNLELGQAAGLIRDNGKYEGAPERIVNEVFAKISGLPSKLQTAYNRIATDYINKQIESVSEK